MAPAVAAVSRGLLPPPPGAAAGGAGGRSAAPADGSGADLAQRQLNFDAGGDDDNRYGLLCSLLRSLCLFSYLFEAGTFGRLYG